MRFALRSRRGPHVSVGQVRSFLATLKFTLVTPCPLLFTTAHCYSPLPTYIHSCPLYSPQPTFIHPCLLLFSPVHLYLPLPTFIFPCPLLSTPANFYSPLFYLPVIAQSFLLSISCPYDTSLFRAVWSSWEGRLIEGLTMSTMSLMSHRWTAEMSTANHCIQAEISQLMISVGKAGKSGCAPSS